MTDKTEAQPEALRLAARLDCDATNADMGRKPIACTRRRAAAELRRLHAEIQQLKAQLSARQAAPEGWRLVPVDFVRGFGNLAHNYSLQAIAPDYYWGNERSAFTDAYARCGHDLAELKALLSAAPPPPEREPQKGETND